MSIQVPFETFTKTPVLWYYLYMLGIINSVKNTYNKTSFVDLLFITSLLLSMTSLVLTRNVNLLFIALCGGSGLYKLLTGYKIKLHDFVFIFSIVGGAYIAYRAHSLGAKSIVLGFIVGALIITTYKAITHERE